MTKLALVGSSYVTALYALAAREIGWKITSLTERRGRQGEERARQIGVELRRPDDIRADADVVVVASDHRYRVEDAIRFLSTGAYVLVETPIALTLENADRLEAVSRSNPGQLRFAANLLFAPLIVDALEITNEIGVLENLEVRALQARPEWDDVMDPEDVNGALFALGIQPVTLALCAASASSSGHVVGVSARQVVTTNNSPDSHATLDISFTSGLTATVEVGWDDRTPVWDFQAASNNGVVRAELLPNPSLELNGEPRALSKRNRSRSDSQLSHLGYVDMLLASTNMPTSRSGATSAGFGPRTALCHNAFEIVFAGYSSVIRDGARIEIPFEGPRDKSPSNL